MKTQISNKALQSRFFRQLFPEGKTALDHVVFNTVGDAEIAGCAEACAWNEQDAILLGHANEFHLIFERRFREQIETAPRLNHLKAKFGQLVVEHVPLDPVFVDIDAGALQVRDQTLHQGRGIDEAEDTVAEYGTFDEQFDIVHIRVGRQVADAVARQGQIFGV